MSYVQAKIKISLVKYVSTRVRRIKIEIFRHPIYTHNNVLYFCIL